MNSIIRVPSATTHLHRRWTNLAEVSAALGVRAARARGVRDAERTPGASKGGVERCLEEGGQARDLQGACPAFATVSPASPHITSRSTPPRDARLTKVSLPSSIRGRRQGQRGGGDDDAELRAQLREIGMRVKEVAADGNCFFRAMCDQRWGSEHHHEALRRHTVAYMKSNRDDFEPFIEDDEKWDAYIERMSEDGTWAGNMELQAASLVCMANVCVHQAGQPRWEIVNFPADRWFHVTYEGSEHYNSARLISDDDDAPGGPITLARSNGAYATRGDVGGREPSAAAVAATVAEAGGACKKTRAREILRLFDGCVQSAAAAVRVEMSYRGVLRGGAGDDPEPGDEPEADDARDGVRTCDPDARDAGGAGDDENDASEDDWEPVVTKGRRGAAPKRRGRRRNDDDDIDERVASLRI